MDDLKLSKARIRGRNLIGCIRLSLEGLYWVLIVACSCPQTAIDSMGLRETDCCICLAFAGLIPWNDGQKDRSRTCKHLASYFHMLTFCCSRQWPPGSVAMVAPDCLSTQRISWTWLRDLREELFEVLYGDKSFRNLDGITL